MKNSDVQFDKTNLLSYQASISDPKEYINAREENRLTLRKKRLDNHLLKKRESLLQSRPKDLTYEIKLSTLSIPQEIVNKTYPSIEAFISEMNSYLQAVSVDLNKFALHQLRKATLSEKNSPDLMYDSNTVDFILPILNKYINDPQVVFESLWILINITMKITKPELTRRLISDYSFDMYTKIIQSGINDNRDNLMWLFLNLSIKNIDAFFPMMNSAILKDDILNYLNGDNKIPTETLKLTICFLAALTDNYIPQVPERKMTQEVIETETKIAKAFCKYINIEDEEISNDCLVGLSNISNSNNRQVFNVIYASGIIRRVVKRLIKISEPFEKLAIHLVGNFLSFIENDVLDPIVLKEIIDFLQDFIINSNDNGKRHSAFWALSNICIEGAEIITKSPVIPYLLNAIKTAEIKVGNEALYCLEELVNNENVDIVIKVAQYEVVDLLVEVVEKYYQVPMSVSLILSSLNGLFHVGELVKEHTNGKNIYLTRFWTVGGRDILEKLQNYNDITVNNSVINIIQTYFSVDN